MVAVRAPAAGDRHASGRGYTLNMSSPSFSATSSFTAFWHSGPSAGRPSMKTERCISSLYIAMRWGSSSARSSPVKLRMASRMPGSESYLPAWAARQSWPSASRSRRCACSRVEEDIVLVCCCCCGCGCACSRCVLVVWRASVALTGLVVVDEELIQVLELVEDARRQVCDQIVA